MTATIHIDVPKNILMRANGGRGHPPAKPDYGGSASTSHH